MHLPGFSLIGI